MDTTQNTQAIPQEHHTVRQWQKKFFGMGAKCYYCGIPMLLKEASKDHLTPRCRGGSDKISNIVPACLPCNQKKGWRTEVEFYKARPALCANPQPRVTKDKPNHEVALEEQVNEPGLLKRLIAERERVSWAWKTPAALRAGDVELEEIEANRRVALNALLAEEL